MKSDRRCRSRLSAAAHRGRSLRRSWRGAASARSLIDGSGRIGQGRRLFDDRAGAPAQRSRRGNERAGRRARPFRDARSKREGGDRRGFAQRRFFGRYLGEILDEAVASGQSEVGRGHGGVGATREGDGWHVEFDDGSSIEARRAGARDRQPGAGRLRAFAGAGDALYRQSVGCRGAGAVTELAAHRRGGAARRHRPDDGRSGAVARCGGPRGTDRRAVATRPRAARPCGFRRRRRSSAARCRAELRALRRWLRRRSAEVGWRAAVDSLRPHSHALVAGPQPDEQRRFLRHARPWWDVHRHRIAPEVAATVARMVADGRLEIVAGRIVAARDPANGIEVDYRRRGAERAADRAVCLCVQLHRTAAFDCAHEGPAAAQPAGRRDGRARTISASASRSMEPAAPASIYGRWGR